MRRTLPTLLITFALLGLNKPAHAQDAGKIIDQYVKAVGGAKVLSRIQTLTIEGALSNAAQDKTGTYTFDTKLPNRYYSELVTGGRSLIEAYNGKSAWRQNAAGEIGTLTGAQGFQLEAAGQYYNSQLVNPKKNKLAVSFAGHVQVRGKDALEIEVSTAKGVKREVFFDPQTHLIVEEKATVAGSDQEIFYDDYRNVEGVKIPYQIELRRGGETYPILVTRAVVNGVVGERVFERRNTKAMEK